MKKSDYRNELRELTQEGLKARVLELQEEKMRVRFKKSSSQLDQKHRVKEVKVKLAQAKTVYAQKFLNAA